MQQEAHSFEPLLFKRRKLTKVTGANEYCVNLEGGEAKIVEAQSAYEAFRLAGATKACKIARLANVHLVVLPKGAIEEAVPNDAKERKALENAAAEEEQIRLLRNPVVSVDLIERLMQQSLAQPDQDPKIVMAGAEGIEVHNDGFDEIIPTANTPTMPSAAAKPAEETPVAPAEEASPTAPADQELSSEQIDNLLKG